MSVRHLAALWLASAWTTALLAQPAPAEGPLRLRDALAAASTNADNRIAAQALAAARADVLAADHGPAPQLTVKASQIDLQNGVGGGDLWSQKRIDKSLGLDWTWERGDKRARRTEAAQRGAQASEADREELGLQQRLAVGLAYFELQAAQQRLQHVQAIASSAATLADTAAKRLRAGDLSVLDSDRSATEAARAAGDAQAARLDRQHAAQALALLTGLDAGRLETQALAEPLPAVPAEPVRDIERRADVRAALARQQAAQAALANALALRRADPVLGASLDHFPGTSTRQLELRVQIPLQGGPFYDAQGEIGRARAQLAQADAALDKARAVARLDALRTAQDLLTGQARWALFDGDIVPRAQRVADAAEKAYARHALPLTDLLDARRALRNTLVDATNAQADLAKALFAQQLRLPPTDTAP